MNGFVVSVLLLCAATGVSGFSVSSSNTNVQVKEDQEADLKCDYSADFGPNVRLEWKFKDDKGSQAYVFYDGKPTEPYASRVTKYGQANMRLSKVTRTDNGTYICEVSGNQQFGDISVSLTVLVPPSVPMCKIPTSVTTGKAATLFCHDPVGSPAPTYQWYKDNILLPADPTKNSNFRNATYRLDQGKGTLEFLRASLTDAGEYYCEATNSAGPAQSCRAVKMEVRDLNTGGIVAGVLVALLLLVLLIVAVWFAKKKGYLDNLTESFTNKPKPSSVYHTAASNDEADDGEFKQKSSFVV
uniref:Junctional adhesion molecule A n=1 Tax=Oryzias sinensis TaxID=183150 RepID=A0A8C7ZZX0_9TELE